MELIWRRTARYELYTPLSPRRRDPVLKDWTPAWYVDGETLHAIYLHGKDTPNLYDALVPNPPPVSRQMVDIWEN